MPDDGNDGELNDEPTGAAPQRGAGPGSAEQDWQPVTRDRGAGGAGGGARTKLIAAGIACAVLLLGGTAFALTRDGDPEPKEVASVETTTTSTTTSTTTTVAAPTGVVAPLTGVLVPEAEAGILGRAALVAKIDNDPAAMPQVGLEQADVVIEVEVEGISRYMAVFHSSDVQEVGPIRSARTTDPALLHMFGVPVFAWSGGNKTVMRIIADTPNIQNLLHDAAPEAYSRTKSKKAPHNLMLDVPKIYERAAQPPVPPPALFVYRPADEAAAGLPTPGFAMSVGKSPLAFVWSPERNGWLRWSNNRRHVDESGNQLAPQNVVVLETPYKASVADSRSPEAQTLGEGRAWVFSGGNVVEGRWTRPSEELPWALTTLDGTPITLAAGSTFVELPPTGTTPRFLSPEEAAQMTAG